MQFLFSYNERKNSPDFFDAKKIAEYSKHGTYRFEDELTRKS